MERIVPYPKTLAEAKDFVEKCKEFAVDPVQVDNTNKSTQATPKKGAADQ